METQRKDLHRCDAAETAPRLAGAAAVAQNKRHFGSSGSVRGAAPPTGDGSSWGNVWAALERPGGQGWEGRRDAGP